MNDLPRYRDLPVRPGAPPGSSWGLWGDDDELGTLNLLTPERVAAAAGLVRAGEVVPLQLPLEEPDPAVAHRGNLVHHIIDETTTRGLRYRDDRVDNLWLQGSSQWDGLTHIVHPEHGNYNGVPDADIHGGPGTRLGVDRWAERGIAGRGVLADVARFRAAAGHPIDPESGEPLDAGLLAATLDAQGTELRTGDVLLVRTGWIEHYLTWSPERRRAVSRTLVSPGLSSDLATVEYLWDAHVAAVAADNVAVECVPGSTPDGTFHLHRHWLPLLGMPLGEYWYLARLSEACARLGRYEFLLVSVPLHIRGGVGSPPQAVAIL